MTTDDFDSKNVSSLGHEDGILRAFSDSFQSPPSKKRARNPLSSPNKKKCTINKNTFPLKQKNQRSSPKTIKKKHLRKTNELHQKKTFPFKLPGFWRHLFLPRAERCERQLQATLDAAALQGLEPKKLGILDFGHLLVVVVGCGGGWWVGGKWSVV